MRHPERDPTESERQFFSKLFAVMCESSIKKVVTTIQHLSQTNGQVEWYNCILITPLCNNFEDH